MTAFTSQSANAFVDSPVLVTTNPIAGQPVLISITAGVCDAIADGTPFPPPAVAQNGASILMTVWTVASLDPEECFYPTATAILTVGTFPVGTYVLQVDRIYLGGGGPVTETLGSLNFTVSAIPTLPTLGVAGELLLALFVVSGSCIALRRRRTTLLVALAFAIAMSPHSFEHKIKLSHLHLKY
jgi:hypothetical protein